MDFRLTTMDDVGSDAPPFTPCSTSVRRSTKTCSSGCKRSCASLRHADTKACSNRLRWHIDHKIAKLLYRNHDKLGWCGGSWTVAQRTRVGNIGLPSECAPVSSTFRSSRAAAWCRSCSITGDKAEQHTSLLSIGMRSEQIVREFAD